MQQKFAGLNQLVYKLRRFSRCLYWRLGAASSTWRSTAPFAADVKVVGWGKCNVEGWRTSVPTIPALKKALPLPPVLETSNRKDGHELWHELVLLHIHELWCVQCGQGQIKTQQVVCIWQRQVIKPRTYIGDTSSWSNKEYPPWPNHNFTSPWSNRQLRRPLVTPPCVFCL